MEAIRAQCPKVKWVSSDAVLGPYDYVDVFEPPGNETAAKVSSLTRTDGRSHSGVWAATEWAKSRRWSTPCLRNVWPQGPWPLPNEEVAHEIQSIARLRRREHETEAMKP